jgi:hypothetical protein
LLRQWICRCFGSCASLRLVFSFLLFLLPALGCATGPRVLEVSSRTRLQDIDAADKPLFEHDQASRIKYQPRDLPAGEQRQDFYVRWRPGPRTVGTHAVVGPRLPAFGGARGDQGCRAAWCGRAALPRGLDAGFTTTVDAQQRVPTNDRSRITLVKFEYRQVDKPGVVKEQTYAPQDNGVPTTTADARQRVPTTTVDTRQRIPTTTVDARQRVPTTTAVTANVFSIRGEDFRAGGLVSAWRVSLWDGDTLLAEKKSVLW